MDKALKEIKDGEQAKQILDNPVYKNAIEGVRQGIISSMATSSLGDEKTHNRLVIALQVLSQIEKQLHDSMQTGKMASMQIHD